MMRVIVLGALAGCGFRIDNPAAIDAPAIDAIDARTIDSPPPGPCIEKWMTPTLTLSAPELVAGIDISGVSERDPFLSTDELVIFWVSPGPGGNDDVFQAQRSSIADPFGPNTVNASLSDTLLSDSKAAMTADGLYVVQSTGRLGGKGQADLWHASRLSAGTTPFGALSQSQVDVLNDVNNQLDPYLSSDGLELYYAIGSPQRIVVAKRTLLTDSFGALEGLAINGSTGDADPALSADGRVLLFSSNNRSGGFDYADIWYATRDDVTQPFANPRIVPVINGMHPDGDAHLSADGCRLYFASARNGGVYNLMVASVQ